MIMSIAMASEMSAPVNCLDMDASRALDFDAGMQGHLTQGAGHRHSFDVLTKARILAPPIIGAFMLLR
jgi:hypothetical protein